MRVTGRAWVWKQDGVGKGGQAMRIVDNECFIVSGIVLNTLSLLICLICTMTHDPNFAEGKLKQGLGNLPIDPRQLDFSMFNYMLGHRTIHFPGMLLTNASNRDSRLRKDV